jgi:hypothetical protein
MSRVVRPRSVALFGLACLAAAVALSLLQLAEPIFWTLYVAAAVAFIGAYGYFAVSLLESGRKVLGWAAAWVPAVALTVAANPSIGIPEMLVATLIEVALLVGAVMLALRVGRWASVRYNLPYPA